MRSPVVAEPVSKMGVPFEKQRRQKRTGPISIPTALLASFQLQEQDRSSSPQCLGTAMALAGLFMPLVVNPLRGPIRSKMHG